MRTAREILIEKLRNDIPDGHLLNEGVITHIECFSSALDAMEEYAAQYNSVIPEMSFDEAETLSMKTDYAWAAVGVEINEGDAAGFFLEGYQEAQRRLAEKQAPWAR